jgi:phosphoribosyl-ATP pyrophosphohydrolase
MNKLVRDKMVKIIESEGRVLRYTILPEDRYKHQLKVKLIEEATEVRNSNSIENLIEEIADVQEVIDCIIKANNLNKKDIKTAQSRKRKNRGSFKKGFFIIEEI